MFLHRIVEAVRTAAMLALAALASLSAAAQFATLVPANPRFMEPVRIRLTTGTHGLYGTYIQDVKITMAGNVIEVAAIGGIDLGASTSRDYLLGQFPAGDYVVRARLGGDPATELRFSVPQAHWIDQSPPPADDFTGLYFDPMEPGWGMSVAQSPGAAFFVVWFVYDEQRRPTWYTIQGGTYAGHCYRAPLVRTQGPPLGGPFDPRTVIERAVGEATVCFPERADAQGYLSYVLEGGPRTVKRIQRQPLD